MTKSTRSATSTTTSSDRRASRPATERMQRLFHHLGEIRRLLDTPQEAFVAVAVRKHPQWGTHTPQLARAGAKMIELLPEEFKDLPFTAADLKKEEETLDEILSAAQYVDGFSSDLYTRATLSKNRLTEMVASLQTAVTATLTDPRTPQADRLTLTKVSAPFRSIQDDRRLAINSTRRENRKNKVSADERVARMAEDVDLLALENGILRGRNGTESTIVRTQPTAPRTARRSTSTGRKTPR